MSRGYGVLAHEEGERTPSPWKPVKRCNSRGVFFRIEAVLESALDLPELPLHCSIVACNRLGYRGDPLTNDFSLQRAGEAYAKQQYDRACDLYAEALAVDPEDYYTKAVLYANRAAALMNRGRNKEALRDCQAVRERTMSLLRKAEF